MKNKLRWCESGTCGKTVECNIRESKERLDCYVCHVCGRRHTLAELMR